MEIIDCLKKILVQVDKWGDMRKSVYDPNADGVVVDSDKLEGNTLSEVQNHPQKTNVKARAYLNADQSIPNNALTVVEFETENYDPDSLFNVSTHRFVAPFPGLYTFKSMVEYLDADVVANKSYCLNFYKNGTQYTGGGIHAAYAAGLNVLITDDIPLDTDDYVDVRAWHNAGVAIKIRAGSIRSYLAVTLHSKT